MNLNSIKKIDEILKNDVLKKLKDKNKKSELFYVGGFLRNYYINQYHNKNLDIKDIDLATNLKPEEIKKILSENNIKTIDTGIEHGTITALVPFDNQLIPIEITTYREDVATDGRRRTVKYANTIEKDLQRRDFTMNAIAANVETFDIENPNNETGIVDVFNGRKDIKNKKLKFVGERQQRILEDHLRVLRYFRFAFQLDLNIDENLIKNVIETNFDISLLSKERIKSELDKIILSLNPDNFEILNNLFSNKLLFSDISYKDTFQKFIGNKKEILKINNKKYENKKEYIYSFIDMDEKMLNKMKFSNEEIKKMRIFKDIHTNKNILDNKKNIKKFLLQKNIDIKTLKDYGIIHNNNILLINIGNIENNKEAYQLKDLEVNGNEILSLLRKKMVKVDKKNVGKILKKLLSLVINEKIKNNKEDLLETTEKFINSTNFSAILNKEI